MLLPVTATTAALCALLLLYTAIATVRMRLRHKVAFGDGDNAELISASRSHGNLAEHAPIVLIMLGLLENAGANSVMLWVIGLGFVVGRIAHIIGLGMPSVPGKAPIPRQIGVITTWLVMAVLAVLLLLGVVG